MRPLSFLILFPLVLSAGCSKALSPDDFLTKALEGDNSEISLGTLAAQKGGAAVAAYGRSLVADHTKARAAAVAVALRNGVSDTTSLLPEASKERAKLDGLSGGDFDKEFASYMVQDHKEDIADFTKEAQSSAPADIRKMAQDTLPDLRKHLAMAQSLK